MSLPRFHIKKGDTRPKIRAELSADPTDVFESVIFNMAQSDGEVIVASTGVIEAQPSVDSGGVVSYQWEPANTNTSGVFRGEFQVTFDDSRIETYPNHGYIEIFIGDDVG